MSEWISGNVIANGIAIHYHRTGGDLPPVVLSHGITGTGLCWTRLAQALEADYDLIMYDARGHGLSDAPESGHNSEERAADLAGTIQALGLGKPCLIGHSMGAATTATTAARYPDLVRCAILEDPPWRGSTSTASAEERAKRGVEWRAEILEHKARTREELIAFARENRPGWSEVEFGPWAEAKQQVSLKVFSEFSAPRMPWQEVVPQITCPILLVTADPERDAIITPAIAQEAAGLWQNGEIVRIDGAGHNIRREQFEQYVQAVRAFLAKVLANSSST